MVFVHHTADKPGEIYLWEEGKPKPRALTTHNAPLIAELDLPRLEGLQLPGRRRRQGPRLAAPAPGIRPEQEVSGRLPDPRRTAGGLARRVARALELPDVRRAAATPSSRSTPAARPATARSSPTRSARTGPGKVYDDLMKGLDFALEKYPFLDKTRVAAAGRLVRRLHGQLDRRPHRPVQGPDQPRRGLRPGEHVRHDRGALVPRVGVRRIPWDKPEHYRERSPSSFAANFKTPTLVIHGALDFRVPDAQGLGMFTSPPAPGRAQPLRLVPRRGPLDRQAPEPDRLVARGAGVAGAVFEVMAVDGGRWTVDRGPWTVPWRD